MANISKSVTAEREQKVRQWLQEGLSVSTIQRSLELGYGFRMNIAKLYKIKNEPKKVENT